MSVLVLPIGPVLADGLDKQPDVEPDGVYCDEVEGGRFGRTVVLAKLNGDDFDDLVVSSDRGVWVYESFGDGLFDFPVELSSIADGSVAKADVNDDGFDDVIISYASGGIDAFYGSASGFAFGATPDWTYFQAGDFGGSGPSLVDAIDVNADGTDDVIVGAPSLDTAYVFYGSASGLPADLMPDVIIEGSATGNSQGGIDYRITGALGSAVAKDGKLCSAPCSGSQFVIGVPGADIDLDDDGFYAPNEEDLGVALVGPRWQFLSGDQVRANFGYELGHAGDVNGDGETDLLISAKGTPSIDPKVFLYLGKDEFAKMNLDYAWAVEEPDARSPGTFGQAVGSGGDINADGIPDIVIGDPRFDVIGGRSQTELGFWGRVYVWLGGTPGPGDPTGLGANPTPADADIKLDASGISANFGASFAPGDLNGDGAGDLVVGDMRGARGCEDFDTGEFRFVETGRVSVYLSTYVPEPGMTALQAAGLMTVLGLSRRRRSGLRGGDRGTDLRV